MKSNDLMLGDYVMHNDKIVIVDAVHKKKIGYHERPDRLTWVREEQIKPIQITPEFLVEKLHFNVECEKDLRYNVLIEDDRLLYSDRLRLSGIVKTHYKGHPKGQFEFSWIVNCPFVESLKITYLHEFQHIIKLCNLKIDIKL